MNLLEVRELSRAFGGVKAVERVAFQIGEGEVVGLIGPNGAGKTTLFNLLSGLLRADSGSIRLGGVEASGLPPQKISALGVSRTFQELRVLADMSARENVAIAFREQTGERLWNLLRHPRLSARVEQSTQVRADALLDSVGLKGRQEDKAGGLSFGQQKVLSVVRAVAQGGRLLLLDEPVAGVAVGLKDAILEIIQGARREGAAVLLIEQDLEAVWRTANRVLFMDEGRIAAVGTPSEIRQDPRVIQGYLD